MNRISNIRFTLIELLVVVSIISILASLLMPALNRAKEAAKKTVCINNEKQLGVAVRMYADEHNDWLPTKNERPSGDDPRGWRLVLAPYLGIDDLDYWWSRHTLCKGVFLCPSYERPDGGDAKWDGGYSWNEEMGRDYVHSWAIPHQRLGSPTHPSQTVLIADTADWITSSGFAWQVANIYPPSDATIGVGNRHGGGINILWTDLHVSWLHRDTVVAGKDGDQDWYYRREK